MKQATKPQNPFLLSGYVSPEFFCDREMESKKLISALRNGRNITLVSPRRMGKTCLIRHIFHLVGQEGHERCYLVDLYQTDSLAGFVSKLAGTVIGTLDTTGERLLKTIGTFFKSLRPVFTIDPQTGEPGLSIDVQPDFAEQSLAEFFSYMEQSGKKCFLAFDEFQRVAEYDDRNVEALLRSHIQHLTNVHFIFSGSQRQVLENMFTSANRPFYQSTQMVNLDSIKEEAYYQFAVDKLERHRQHIDKTTFGDIYHRLYGHTWYIQVLLNRLYEAEISQIGRADVNGLLHEIVDENEATFQTLLRLITPAQRKVLRAVAAEQEVTEINGKSFISRHKLGAASTVNAVVKSLVEKELLLEHNGSYSVYDRFLSLYLRSNV